MNFLYNLSDVLNGAVLATATALAILVTPVEPAPTPVHAGFNCVRPFFHETVVLGSGSPRVEKTLGGFLPCREMFPVDKDGYLVFPEA